MHLSDPGSGCESVGVEVAGQKRTDVRLWSVQLNSFFGKVGNWELGNKHGGA